MPDRPRTLVVVVHPDPESLTHQAAAQVAASVASWGEVEVADLHREGFDPRFSLADRRHYQGAAEAPADVVAEQRRIDRASDLVLVFPVYWWSMPALLKGWVDRVFVSDWAFAIDDDSRVVPRLQGLTTHLLMVAGADHGSYTRHGYDVSIRTQIEHGIVSYCGSPLGATAILHDSEADSPEVRRTGLDQAVAAVTASYVDRFGRPGPGAAAT